MQKPALPKALPIFSVLLAALAIRLSAAETRPATAAGPAMTQLDAAAMGEGAASLSFEKDPRGPRSAAGAVDAVGAKDSKVPPPALTGPSQPQTVTLPPQPESYSDRVKKRAKGDGCDGFFSCMGNALVSPIVVPFLTTAAGGILGAAIGSKGGVILGIVGGVVGAVIGLAVGVVLAPVALVTGVFGALGKLFKGQL